MKEALLVYESMFGNTREIAQAIADGLSATTHCTLVEVGVAPTVVEEGVDLLVIGAPTHAFGLPTSASRHEAQVEWSRPIISAELGVREWLAALVVLTPRVRVAAFDTHTKQKWVPGSASHRIVQGLRHKGLRGVEGRSFYVEGKQGPLLAGERERAKEWGLALGRQLTEAAASSSSSS